MTPKVRDLLRDRVLDRDENGAVLRLMRLPT